MTVHPNLVIKIICIVKLCAILFFVIESNINSHLSKLLNDLFSYGQIKKIIKIFVVGMVKVFSSMKTRVWSIFFSIFKIVDFFWLAAEYYRIFL